MKTKQPTRHPVAIPTTFKGIEFKSRLEAQTAYLFETFSIPWQYEPISLMLPNGICYTPDFYLPRQVAFVECRGYETKKGQRQLECFGEQVQRVKIFGPKLSDCHAHGLPIRLFIIITGDQGTMVYRRGEEWRSEGVLLSRCCCCNSWSIGGFYDDGCPNGIMPCASANALREVLSLTSDKGKLFLNMKSSEEWGNGSFSDD